MKPKTYLSASAAKRIETALTTGQADEAFVHLAHYLKGNKFRLSDQTLRLYVEFELFRCFEGRGDTFATLVDAKPR